MICFPDTRKAHDLTRTRKEKSDFRQLPTEQILPAATGLDRMSSLEIVRLMNQEDSTVAAAVGRALPQIARAIDVVVAGLRRGGRLIYVGAGTSGRIGALDASEIPPTFNTNPRSVQYIMAGGPKALAASTEASEHDTSLALEEIKKRKPGKRDIVLGIASSGRTPFTIAAVEYAHRRRRPAHSARRQARYCSWHRQQRTHSFHHRRCRIRPPSRSAHDRAHV